MLSQNAKPDNQLRTSYCIKKTYKIHGNKKQNKHKTKQNKHKTEKQTQNKTKPRNKTKQNKMVQRNKNKK